MRGVTYIEEDNRDPISEYTDVNGYRIIMQKGIDF
jgi:hypothetical protein